MGFPELSRKTSGATMELCFVERHVGRFFLPDSLVRVTEVMIADKDSAVALPRTIVGRQVGTGQVRKSRGVAGGGT